MKLNTYLYILFILLIIYLFLGCSLPKDREKTAMLTVPGTMLYRNYPETTDTQETFVILTKDSTEIVLLLVTNSKTTYTQARVPIQQYCKRE